MTGVCASRKSQRGVTLVEILVTVVIISVGLLGVAALHTLTLQNGQDAHIRTQATALASDVIDRMRANRNAAINGDYDIALDSDGPTVTGTSSLAERDMSAWLTLLKSVLPKGDGSVVSNVVAGKQVITVTIYWGERSAVDKLNFKTEVQI